MKATKLLQLLKKAGKRSHLVGDCAAGAVVALDMEGRWYAVLDGEVLNRVNPEAIAGQSTREKYLNPGGDGLWPAPEGTALGYEYASGAWRVPPGLTAARYLLAQAGGRNAAVRAEVDLVNNRGRGIPAIFQRHISVFSGKSKKSLDVKVRESITYIGAVALKRSECLLAPWTLCQFDSGPGCKVVFPSTRKASVWDLYDQPSDAQRGWDNQMCSTRTDGSQRYQIAIGANAPWIEFHNPKTGLVVRRTAEPLPAGLSYIDISDSAPDQPPGKKGVRYSVYSDPSNFMEIEAAGGCPAVIRPNMEMSLEVNTNFTLQ